MNLISTETIGQNLPPNTQQVFMSIGGHWVLVPVDIEPSTFIHLWNIHSGLTLPTQLDLALAMPLSQYTVNAQGKFLPQVQREPWW